METPIRFDGVQVTRVLSLGFFCLIQEREVFIGANVPLAGTTVRSAGDEGALVLPRWFVRENDLREP